MCVCVCVCVCRIAQKLKLHPERLVLLNIFIDEKIITLKTRIIYIR